jgi:NADH dehydrogenase
MAKQRILVLGGGFAGLWAAVGAARRLDELHIGPDDVEITLINRDAFHGIRVRNYEADLSDVRVPLDDVLAPVGVRTVLGDVTAVDPERRVVQVSTGAGLETCEYDRLVVALGSQLARPPITGLAEHAFDVDTYVGAARLAAHLESLSQGPASVGQWTGIVVGAGLTGIETACELPGRLRGVIPRPARAGSPRVILADHSPQVGSDMGPSARPVIEQALRALGVETRLGVEVTAVSPEGISLRSGDRIAAATVVWCAGMRAHPLTQQIGRERDRFGRLPVDEFLRVRGVPGVFAAGDAADLLVTPGHGSVMSCQHGRPMGRFAGYNVVGDLLGLPMLPLRIDWYVTVLDLGPWGAVYTEGWDRHVVATGAAAKRTKQLINCERIYPPRNRDRAAILAAAAPVVQAPPPSYRE